MSPRVKTIRLNMLVFDGTHERAMHQSSPFGATNASNGGNLSSQKFTWRMQMSRNVVQPGGVSVEKDSLVPQVHERNHHRAQIQAHELVHLRSMLGW